jgi:4-cresol dehydrogenase (hydroxylating) flavoprotein subunit
VTNLAEAIAAWQDLLGYEQVLIDREILQAVQTATFQTTQSVPVIIRPKCLTEVQNCLRIANQYRVAIYPISAGKNWGYGSRVPVHDKCAVMDLSRMNRILDLNEDLAYVTLEPGVTFAQLCDFLQKQGSNLIVSMTGSTPYSSIIGNTVERGVGKGPYGDRFNYICGLEVVLPTGECVHTGFGRFNNAAGVETSRWGVGPYLDGLFTQSNLGIVTKMTLWLMPRPKYFQYYIYYLNDDTRLDQLLDAVRGLRLAGFQRGPALIHNIYRQMALIRPYPWQEAADQRPLSLELLLKLKENWKWGGLWNGQGALFSANREHGAAERAIITNALADKVDRLVFLNEDSHPNNPLLTKNTFLGHAVLGSVKSIYWRKPTLPENDFLSLDPDRDACGVIWLSPAIPFEAKHIRTALMIMTKIMVQYGFEPNLGINCISERSVDITGLIIYDRTITGEDDRALRCHDEALTKLATAGYLPYRLGIQSMNSLPPPIDDYGKLLSRLKRALDPNDVLAPGRYDFRADWPQEDG